MCEQCQKKPIVKADKDSETDNGLKGYYNTESRACAIKISRFCRKGLFNVKIIKLADGQHPGVRQCHQYLEQQGSLGDEWRHYKIQGKKAIATTLKLKLRDQQLGKDKIHLF